MGSLFVDGNLGTAYNTLQDLERALAVAQGPPPPGHAGQMTSQVCFLLKDLDWSLAVVKTFLQKMTGPKSAADAVDEAVHALKKAEGMAAAGWIGDAEEAFAAKIKKVTSNCEAVGEEIETMAQDLVGVEGEIRKPRSAPKGAAEIMDEIMDEVRKKAEEINTATAVSVAAVLAGSLSPSDEQTVTTGFEDLKAFVGKQFERILKEVCPLTNRHTGPSDGYTRLH